MSAGLVIHSTRLVDDGRVTNDAWVAFRDGRVEATGTDDGWRGLAVADVVDAREVAGADAVLAPGFVDIHGHGGGGAAHEDGVDAIRAVRDAHRRHGTTSAVVSLVTAPIDDLVRQVQAIAALTGTEGVLGSHLEGPFLDSGHRGAHDPALLRSPDPADVDRLLDAAHGSIRQVTLAPELAGADAAIRRLSSAGVAVAVGHTGADAATTRRAFDAGASILTHAFNAMPGLHHRAPGPVAAALRDERVTLEIIADGAHVDLDMVAIAFAVAPERIALVTDAMAAAGADDGRYELGALAVDVTGGVARLADGGALAGSTLTQDVALRRTVAAGVPLATAITALTSTPARAVGAREVGHLHPGGRADAVLLDAALEVREVWAGGQRVRD